MPNKEGVTLGAQACRRQDQFTPKGYIWSRDGTVPVRRLSILLEAFVSLKKTMMLLREQDTVQPEGDGQKKIV